MISSSKKIPIILVTGFLGSGKTTFINWLLSKNSTQKISIILNEFGDKQLESKFVKYHAENIAELANGCMCCVAKSDIPRIISFLVEKSPQTEYILIEASGLSDPDPVREALQSTRVTEFAYLESTICLIDAVNFEQMRAEHAIISSQIADADIVLLNKVESAGDEQVSKVKLSIESLAPDIRVLSLTDNLPCEIFLTKSVPKIHRQTGKMDHKHVHEDYDVYWYETLVPFDLEKLSIVIKELPAEIIRIKGVVKYFDNIFFKTVTVQRVGSRISCEPYSKSGLVVKSSILFIGKKIDQDKIKKMLDNSRLFSI